MRQDSHRNNNFVDLTQQPFKASPLKGCFSAVKFIISKRFTLFSLAFLVMLSTLMVAFPQPTKAVTTTGTMSSLDMAKSFSAYRWLRSCINRNNLDSPANSVGRISQEKASSFNWFFGKSWAGVDGNVSTSGVINEPKDGDTSCGEDEGDTLLRNSAALWGYSTGGELLCDLGFTREVGSSCASTSDSGSNDFIAPSGAADKVDTWWKNKIGNSSTGIESIAVGGEYSLYLQSFITKCGTPSPNGEYTIQVFTAGSKAPIPTKYTTKDRDYTADKGDVKIYQEKSMKCGELAGMLDKTSSPAVMNYAIYLQQGGTDSNQPAIECPPGSTDPKCAAGVGATACKIEGIGWIICPFTVAMAGLTDSLYDWIVNFLRVQPLNINTGASDNTTYIAWASMRTFANLIFVIVFLVIIFSQLTGAGVSNYGVKKMLPRLVIAAILVNVSFWIAAIAVDVFNIVGSGVYALVRNLPLGNISITDNIWETVLGWLLAGGAAGSLAIGSGAVLAASSGGALLTAGMWMAIVFVLGAVLSLIVAFLIMAARQALIIILIVISPLAFVAYILPNTERYFTLWRKALTTLLVFYPLFALLFSGSYIAGMIIIGSAGQADNEAAVGMTVILGMAVMVVPLAITPLIIRFSSGILGTVAGMINNKNRGLIDRARKVKDRKTGLAVNETFGRPGSRNPFSRVYRRMQSSARGDAQRQKIVDANNAATYGRSNKGTDLSMGVNLAQQQEELVGAEHKAEFDEMKSNKDFISVNNPNAAKINQARTAQEGIEIANSRTGSARSVLQTRMSERYNANPNLVTEAAGIGGQNAESRIRAGALSTIIEESNKAIAAERTTMSKTAVGDTTDISGARVPGLDSIMRDTAQSAERRAAAASQIMKTGGDSDIHKTLDYLSSISGSGEAASTIQQQVAADIGGRKPLALGAADMANMGRGQYKGEFKQKILGRISAGKVSAEALHGASADELQEFAQAIPQLDVNDPQRAILKAAIANYKSNVNYRPPADEIARSINDIESRL